MNPTILGLKGHGFLIRFLHYQTLKFRLPIEVSGLDTDKCCEAQYAIVIGTNKKGMICRPLRYTVNYSTLRPKTTLTLNPKP